MLATIGRLRCQNTPPLPLGFLWVINNVLYDGDLAEGRSLERSDVKFSVPTIEGPTRLIADRWTLKHYQYGVSSSFRLARHRGKELIHRDIFNLILDHTSSHLYHF